MSTRSLRLTLALLAVACGLAGAQDQPAHTVIRKATGAITVDGALDEADWQRAAPVPASFVWGKKDELNPQPRLTVRYLWDDFFLYIGYEVQDENLVVIPAGEPQGPAGNQRQGCEIWVDPPRTQVDLVEFFLVFDNPQFFWEIHHNAADHFNDVLIINELPAWKKNKPALAHFGIYFARDEFIPDEEIHTFAKAVRLTGASTVNQEDDRDVGFTGELRLPWYGIGAPVRARRRIEVEPKTATKPAVTKAGPWQMKNQTMRILAIVQNGDGEHRYFTSCPNLVHGAFFHAQVDRYPAYVFGEE